MDRVDPYLIGINLEVTGDANEKFQAMIDKVMQLNEKLLRLTDSFKIFNATLTDTSVLLKTLNTSFDGFAAKAATSFRVLTSEAKLFNREMEGNEVLSHLSGHFGKELGVGGKAGMGMLAGLGFGEGTLVTGGAVALGYMGYKGFEAQANYQRMLAQLKAQGLGAPFEMAANRAAMGENLPGISHVAYLQAIGEGAAVTRNSAQALALAPILAKMTFADKIAFAREGRRFTPNDAQMLLKSAELMSSNMKTSSIKASLNRVQKVFSMEGGNLRPEDVLGFARRAASVVPHLSFQGLLALVPPIQDLHGNTVGSTLRVFESTMLRGQNFRTGKVAREELMRLGITNKAGIANDIPLLESDPDKWFNDVVLKQFKAHGITSQSAIQAMIFKLFSGTIPNLMMQMITDREKIIRARKLGGQAFGPERAFKEALSLPSGQIGQMSAAWTNLAQAFGKLSSPVVIAGINMLTDAFTRLTQFITYVTGRIHANEKKGYSLNQVFNAVSEGNSQLFSGFTPGFIKSNTGTNMVQVHAVHNLDGKAIAKSVTHHQNNEAELPLSSGNSLETNWFTHGLPVGMNWGGNL